MSVQRSPPASELLNLNSPNPTHYHSDTALHETSHADSGNHYFNVTKRQKRNFDGITPPSPTSTSSEIKALFAELLAQQDKKFEQVNATLSTITAQNQDIQKAVDTQNKELLLKISHLELENKEQRDRISVLEYQLDHQEKYIRATTVEVRNIPKQEDENKKALTSIIQNLGASLKLEPSISESEIRDVYRNKSDTIVVDFTTTRRKESIISTLKSFNKLKRENKEPQLNTALIKLPGDSRNIFISEHLSYQARKLFYLARLYVKNKTFAAAWTSYGKVYIKEKEGSPPQRIDNESELNKLIA